MKDKRIFIQSFKNRPCVDCPAASNMKNCTCPDLHRFSHGINKSEAIDKMAKAIYSEMEKETKTIKSKYTFSSKKFAEAALKALLEDK